MNIVGCCSRRKCSRNIEIGDAGRVNRLLPCPFQQLDHNDEGDCEDDEEEDGDVEDEVGDGDDDDDGDGDGDDGDDGGDEDAVRALQRG